MPILTQFQNSEQSIVIDGAVIHQDQYGRFCLNDLHKASGSAQKDQPRYFLENKQTQALIQALIDSGIPLSPVEIIKGGTNQGTYVVKQIVYAYAMWISANFHLKVINTFDALVTQKPAELSRMDLIQLALQAEEENQVLRSQVAILEPKAKGLDRIADCANVLGIRESAKVLKIGQNQLTQYLIDHKVVYRDNFGKIQAYQKSVDQKLVHVVTSAPRLFESGEKVFTQVKLTQKLITRISTWLEKGVAA
nr:KilA-N domain-containing protein [Acinetobacter shaoyimingii]